MSNVTGERLFIPRHLRGFVGTKRAFFIAEHPWVMTSALQVE